MSYPGGSCESYYCKAVSSCGYYGAYCNGFIDYYGCCNGFIDYPGCCNGFIDYTGCYIVFIDYPGIRRLDY